MAGYIFNPETAALIDAAVEEWLSSRGATLPTRGSGAGLVPPTGPAPTFPRPWSDATGAVEVADGVDAVAYSCAPEAASRRRPPVAGGWT